MVIVANLIFKFPITDSVIDPTLHFGSILQVTPVTQFTRVSAIMTITFVANGTVFRAVLILIKEARDTIVILKTRSACHGNIKIVVFLCNDQRLSNCCMCSLENTRI